MAAVDWQGIAAVIAAFGAATATVIGALNRRSIRTPSGDRIGLVAERTHDLAAVATLATTGAIQHGNTPPPVTPGPGLDHSVDRINSDINSTIKVNGQAEGMHS